MVNVYFYVIDIFHMTFHCFFKHYAVGITASGLQEMVECFVSLLFNYRGIKRLIFLNSVLSSFHCSAMNGYYFISPAITPHKFMVPVGTSKWRIGDRTGVWS